MKTHIEFFRNALSLNVKAIIRNIIIFWRYEAKIDIRTVTFSMFHSNLLSYRWAAPALSCARLVESGSSPRNNLAWKCKVFALIQDKTFQQKVCYAISRNFPRKQRCHKSWISSLFGGFLKFQVFFASFDWNLWLILTIFAVEFA